MVILFSRKALRSFHRLDLSTLLCSFLDCIKYTLKSHLRCNFFLFFFAIQNRKEVSSFVFNIIYSFSADRILFSFGSQWFWSPLPQVTKIFEGPWKVWGSGPLPEPMSSEGISSMCQDLNWTWTQEHVSHPNYLVAKFAPGWKKASSCPLKQKTKTKPVLKTSKKKKKSSGLKIVISLLRHPAQSRSEALRTIWVSLMSTVVTDSVTQVLSEMVSS